MNYTPKPSDIPVLNELVDRLKAELEKHRWIPVEEGLPENGRGVLICWHTKIEKNVRVSRGWYAKKFQIVDEGEYFESAEYDKKTDEYYFPEGWWEVPWESEAAFPLSNVTHWKPIILPEQELKGGEE